MPQPIPLEYRKTKMDYLPRPYPYHSSVRRSVARTFDMLGDKFFGDKRRQKQGSKEVPDPAQVREVLVVRLDHLGDVVFATAAFGPLRDLYPKARVTALVGPWSAPLLLHHPVIDEVVEFRNPWFDRSEDATKQDILSTLQWIRSRRFDVGIDLRGDPRIISLLALGGVRYRIGYGWGGGGFLLSQELNHSPGVHQVERNVAPVQALGWNRGPEFSPMPFLQVSTPEMEAMSQKLASCGWDGNEVTSAGRTIYIEDGEKIAVLHPGAGFPAKRWKMDRYGALAKWLAEKGGYRIVLIGSEKEESLATEVIKSAGNFGVLNLCGRNSVRELMAVLSRADLMIGNDSGPAHIAAALGTRTVALFSGTNNVGEWAPVGTKTRVVRNEVPCSPCSLKECVDYNHECMENLTLEAVKQSVQICKSL